MSTAQKTKRQRSKTVANVFGTLGYLSILLQWTWTLLLLCYPLITADHSFLLPNTPAEPFHPTNTAVASSPITAVLAIAVTAFILVATVIVIARLPKQIGKRGAQITHQTADSLIPIVTKHRPIPQKKRRVLSYRIILIAKVVAILLPIAGLVWTASPYPLTDAIVWTIGIYCAGWSATYFMIQQAIGFFAKIDTRQLW